MSLIITPETRLAALLEAYPAVEPILLNIVPALSTLTNPALRGAVARTTTLEQAARLAGTPVKDLVLLLRAEVGDDAAPVAEAAPSWLAQTVVRHRIDAGAMLATGVHPIGAVRQAAASLEENESLEMTSPFRPVPLLATMVDAGFAVHCAEQLPGLHLTIIARVAGAPAPQLDPNLSGCGSSGCGH